MGEPSPRFRQDLVASATEADGVPCVDVSDPQTGTTFRLYDFEYQLALQLNGQPLEDVTIWASAAYGVDLTAEGVSEFAGRLAELGFLEPSSSDAATPVPEEMATPGPEAVESGPVPTAAELADSSGPSDADSGASEWMSPQAAQTAQYIPDLAMLSSSSSPPDRTPVAPDLPILEALAAADSAPVEAEPTTKPGTAPASGPISLPPPPVVPVAAAPLPSVLAAPPPVAPAPAVSVAVTRPSEAPTVRLPPEARVSIPVTRPSEAPTVPAIPSAMASFIPPTKEGSGKVPAPMPGMPPAAAAPPAPQSSRWANELDGTLGGPPASPAQPPSGPPSMISGSLPPTPAVAHTNGPLGAPSRASAAPPGLPERRQPPGPEAVVMSGFSSVEVKSPAGSSKRSARIAIVLLLVLAAAITAFFMFGRGGASVPQAVRVRVFSPRPTAVYRWFTGRGVVVEDEPRTLAFDSPGRVSELWPPGTEFTPTDIVGRLQPAAGVETLLAHHRSRLAFYQQMLESMRAAGNAAEARQAELKLADKRRLVDETAASLAHLTLRSAEPGEVVEVLAKVGALAKPGMPVMKIKGRLLHGAFELDGDELTAASKIDLKAGLCRVEVIGLGPHASNTQPRRTGDSVSDSGSPDAQNVPRFIDCTVPARSGGKMRVALPGDLGLVPGQPLRLARQRYDAVFPIPAAAVMGQGDGGRRALWIAGRDGAAERREVTVVDTADEEALVSDGLNVGEEVVLDAPATLAPGARLQPER